MFNFSLSSILKPSTIAGVNITIDGERMSFSFCVLKRQKDIIKVIKAAESGETFEELKQSIGNDIPLALSIQGKGILHKPVPKEKVIDKTNIGEIVKLTFPAIKTEEFYAQVYSFSTGSIVSLLRKDLLERILKELQDNGMQVYSVSLGPFSVNNLVPFLGQKVFNFHLSNFYFEVADREVRNSYLGTASGEFNETIRVGSEMLKIWQLVPYGAALNELLFASSNGTILSEIIQGEKSNSQQQQLLKTGSLGILLFFFCALLVNFLIYNHLNSENGILAQQVQKTEDLLKEKRDLEVEQEKNKKFFLHNGWLQGTKNSFYSDKLAATVPLQVYLTELNVSPVDDTESRVQKRLVIKSGIIQVKGTCNNSLILNEWIKRVSKYEWVLKVQDQVFTYDYKNKVGKFEFFIQLKQDV
ncbi:hypothetical protein [Adhaeribacter soli]|uniref:PilN domain-containing protein n=1 Tax=Adhaeribacter soli TaxID=2607655 RepID=A0A5N1ILY7_9BACT|nr:hypothetical protein [Adhaeribacter soli]KAA9324917.1 hypothetical protein F0P94_19520 [Adhaeribacter soli]